jgi:hypothetical protein
MSIGETVIMTEGPFLGMYGTIVGSRRRRVVIAVVCRSREVQVEIDRDCTIAARRHCRSISRIESLKLSRRVAGS